MLLPVSLGRGIFSSISSIPISYGVKCNGMIPGSVFWKSIRKCLYELISENDLIFEDLYAFNIGCYVIWATIAAIGYAVDYLKTHNARILLMQIVKWTGIVTKSSMLLSLWV
jgi:E3 ubiquitin-protein ligase MARCH6